MTWGLFLTCIPTSTECWAHTRFHSSLKPSPACFRTSNPSPQKVSFRRFVCLCPFMCKSDLYLWSYSRLYQPHSERASSVYVHDGRAKYKQKKARTHSQTQLQTSQIIVKYTVYGEASVQARLEGAYRPVLNTVICDHIPHNLSVVID